LIAAGERVLAACDLSDPDAPVWAEPIPVPGGNIECLDATVVNGRAVAATGGWDGTFCIWDMTDRRLLAEPNTAHRSAPCPDAPSEVFAVRFAELDTRPVAITCGRDGSLRVWDLPSTGNDKRS
jgi:WD40 repeat protein